MHGNGKLFMKQTSSKGILQRTRLRKRFLQNLNVGNKFYKNTEIYVSFLRKEKRYFVNLK